MSGGESAVPTPHAVLCPAHGRVFLTREEYRWQMSKADTGWTCPRMSADDDLGLCGRRSRFDDDTHEEWIDANRPEDAR